MTAYEHLSARGALRRTSAGTRPARRAEFDVLLAQHQENVRAARRRLQWSPTAVEDGLDAPITWFIGDFEGIGTVLVFLVPDEHS